MMSSILGGIVLCVALVNYLSVLFVALVNTFVNFPSVVRVALVNCLYMLLVALVNTFVFTKVLTRATNNIDR